MPIINTCYCIFPHSAFNDCDAARTRVSRIPALATRQEILQPFIAIRVLEKPVELFQGQMFFTWRVVAGNAYPRVCVCVCVGVILASIWRQKIPGDQFQRDSSLSTIAGPSLHCICWQELHLKWSPLEMKAHWSSAKWKSASARQIWLTWV